MSQTLELYVPDEVIRKGTAAIAIYHEAIANGSSQFLATMFACRQAPGARTDREYFERRNTLDDQFKGEPGHLSELVKTARSMGYNPSPNDVYEPGLVPEGAPAGHPMAWISPSGGRGELEAKCRALGVGCQGIVNLPNPEPIEETPCGQLADDLVQEEIALMAAQNPDILRKVDYRDLVEEVRYQNGFTDAKTCGEVSDELLQMPAAQQAMQAALAAKA